VAGDCRALRSKMADGGDVASVGAHREAMPHAVCRRLSSSDESGFNSDLSDDHNASPPAIVDEVVRALNGLAVVEGSV